MNMITASRGCSRATRLLIILLATFSPDARADHLVVSRHALVKDHPSTDGSKIIAVEEGEELQLVPGAIQSNGYYKVDLGNGTGWIYRTFVRRFPGDLEDFATHDTGVGVPSDSEDRDIIFGTPTCSESVQILDNDGYTVGYSPTTKGPLWVSYSLFAVGNKKSPEREDLFAADARVADPVPANGFEGTGYDRGHMAPSAPVGRRYGKVAQDKTFLMTNMVPQVPGLNQRGWEAVESVISSSYAEDFGEVWVIAGPIFEGDCRVIKCGARVPSATFMVIVDIDESNNNLRTLSLVMPQRRINEEHLSDFVTTIDDIEARTGLDLFPDLPDNVETAAEAAAPDATVWNTSQVLHPKFAGTARAIHTKACGS